MAARALDAVQASMLDVGPVRLGSSTVQTQVVARTHLIFSMAFGGSGWAGGLRDCLGRALAVDIFLPARPASLSDKWANAPVLA